MNKDFISMLDSIEEEHDTRLKLEQTVNNLRGEISTLHQIIKEQNVLIQSQEKRMEHQDKELPENINILKEIIISQRREITQMDSENETLKLLIDKFTGELEDVISSRESQFVLTDIPGIGKKIAGILNNGGIKTINDLINSKVEIIAKDIPGVGVKRLKKWKNHLIKRTNVIRST